MRRTLVLLTALLSVSVTLAGCFDDDDGGDDKDVDPSPSPSPTETPTPEEPNIPPIASFNATLSGGTTTTAPFFARPGSNLNITFDAAGSSDPDGNVTDYVWKITKGPEEYRGSGVTFNVSLDQVQANDFGLYAVILRVVDDDFNVTETNGTFALNYEVVYEQTIRMVGPGTASRTDANEQQAGAPLEGNTRGTFTLHDLTIVDNATRLDVNVVFAPTIQAKMKLFVFKPADKDAHGTAEPLAQSDSKASPIDLTTTDVGATGVYRFRLELDGESVNNYTMTAKVTYG